MKFCHQCGTALVDDSRFCSACGVMVASGAPRSPASPSPTPGDFEVRGQTPTASREFVPRANRIPAATYLFGVSGFLLLIGSSLPSHRVLIGRAPSVAVIPPFWVLLLCFGLATAHWHLSYRALHRILQGWMVATAAGVQVLGAIVYLGTYVHQQYDAIATDNRTGYGLDGYDIAVGGYILQLALLLLICGYFAARKTGRTLAAAEGLHRGHPTWDRKLAA